MQPSSTYRKFQGSSVACGAMVVTQSAGTPSLLLLVRRRSICLPQVSIRSAAADELLAVQLPGREELYGAKTLLRMEQVIEYAIDDITALSIGRCSFRP